jgi:hypothetical protein
VNPFEERGPIGRLVGWLRAECLALPLAALAVAVAELAAVRGLYQLGFGGARRFPEAADLPLAHAVLWLGGFGCAALAAAGAYRLVRRGRWWLAALLVPLVCAPVLVIGLASVYGSLVTGAVL